MHTRRREETHFGNLARYALAPTLFVNYSRRVAIRGNHCMEAPKLKLFSPTAENRSPEGAFVGSDTSSGSTEGKSEQPTMPVAIRDLVPLLVDAFQTDRTWLKDFERESIQVTPDLYDVLLAYQQFRRCDAA